MILTSPFSLGLKVLGLDVRGLMVLGLTVSCEILGTSTSLRVGKISSGRGFFSKPSSDTREKFGATEINASEVLEVAVYGLLFIPFGNDFCASDWKRLIRFRIFRFRNFEFW